LLYSSRAVLLSVGGNRKGSVGGNPVKLIRAEREHSSGDGFKIYKGERGKRVPLRGCKKDMRGQY